MKKQCFAQKVVMKYLPDRRQLFGMIAGLMPVSWGFAADKPVIQSKFTFESETGCGNYKSHLVTFKVDVPAMVLPGEFVIYNPCSTVRYAQFPNEILLTVNYENGYEKYSSWNYSRNLIKAINTMKPIDFRQCMRLEPHIKGWNELPVCDFGKIDKTVGIMQLIEVGLYAPNLRDINDNQL